MGRHLSNKLGLGELEFRARMAIPVLWGFALVSLATAGTQVMEAMGMVNLETGESTLDIAAGLTYLSYAIAYFASIVFVAFWIHRGHANLTSIGLRGLDYSPNWAVGWFFIPLANLFKPFGAMKELWNASHGAKDQFDANSPAIMKVWWGTWIAGNVATIASERVTSAGSTQAGIMISAASNLLLVVAAIYLIKVIHGVTDAQISGLHTGRVFA